MLPATLHDESEAQRRRWTFYETIIFPDLRSFLALKAQSETQCIRIPDTCMMALP